MSFLPKPGEIIEDDDLYEFSGDEDNRLRKEYEWLIKNYSTKVWGYRDYIQIGLNVGLC